MILKVKNLGKLHNESAIEINGITVLAGENGTGKSTIGKILFCIYSTLYDYENQVIKEKADSIRNIGRILNRQLYVREYSSIWNKIAELVENTPNNDCDLKNRIIDIYKITESELSEDVFDRIKKVLFASEKNIVNAIFKRYLNSEFNSQLGHVNFPGEETVIELKIKDETIKAIYGEGPSFESKIQLTKDLVYIDDPFVIDDISSVMFSQPYYHRTDLTLKLRTDKVEQLSAADDVIINDKLAQVYQKLEKVCGGNIKKNNNEEYYYTDSHLKAGLSVKNLSTGLKSFVIIKTLLQRGYLEENGIVVLDEPETHQHPEWMLVYAEIIVLLHNIFGINFVISTHSAELLSYIELYTHRYHMADKCKYYMLINADKDKSVSEIKDYTNDIQGIYEKLSRPFIAVSRELDEIDE